MASKRQRGESSRSTQPFDKKRFVSFHASQRYSKLLSGKNLVPERGLLPRETQDGNMAVMIRAQNWQTFTQQPEPAAVNVVKEFYANAKAAEGNSVFVRGKWVNVGQKAINAYYGLQKIRDCEYADYLQSHLDYSEIITSLCEPGTDWKATATQEAVNFPQNKLSRYGKAWYGFICAKLMPSRHVSDVTKERAALLYCIAMGKSVDVGDVIHASIMKVLDGSTSGGLPHPSLISGLCKRAGVQWDKEEVLQAPYAPIDHSVIARYKVWNGGISHPHGLGYIIVPAEPAIDGPPEPEIPMPPPDIVEELRRDSRHHTRRIDLVARLVEKAIQRIDCVAQRQESILAYHAEAFASLAQMIANLPVSLPNPPVLPVYPPPSPDLNDEMDVSDD